MRECTLAWVEGVYLVGLFPLVSPLRPQVGQVKQALDNARRFTARAAPTARHENRECAGSTALPVAAPAAT